MSDPEFERALRAAEEIELVTTGRRTGRPHQVTLWFAVDGGDIWLRTDRTADWYRNLEREPRCHIAVGGIVVAAMREPVADQAASLRRLVELWRAKYGAEWVSDWYVERGRIAVRLRAVG